MQGELGSKHWGNRLPGSGGTAGPGHQNGFLIKESENPFRQAWLGKDSIDLPVFRGGGMGSQKEQDTVWAVLMFGIRVYSYGFVNLLLILQRIEGNTPAICSAILGACFFWGLRSAAGSRHTHALLGDPKTAKQIDAYEHKSTKFDNTHHVHASKSRGVFFLRSPKRHRHLAHTHPAGRP